MTHTTNPTQEVSPMPTTDYRSYELTGDLLVDRAHYVEAGRPSDHPYIVDCSARVAQRDAGPVAPVEPLALTLTSGQAAAMEVLSPVLRAQSDANVAALLAGGR